MYFVKFLWVEFDWSFLNLRRTNKRNFQIKGRDGSVTRLQEGDETLGWIFTGVVIPQRTWKEFTTFMVGDSVISEHFPSWSEGVWLFPPMGESRRRRTLPILWTHLTSTVHSCGACRIKVTFNECDYCSLLNGKYICGLWLKAFRAFNMLTGWNHQTRET